MPGPSKRECGVLLHPTSLPGPFGVGGLGAEARHFVDFLASSGASVWQVLPLGPTGYGDSPYQAFSAFAGNPLLIDLDELVSKRLLPASALAAAPAFSTPEVDYSAALAFKAPLLKKAYEAFEADAGGGERGRFSEFCSAHADWLEDFALFTAAKAVYKNKPWTQWDAAVAAREPGALEKLRARVARPILETKFAQFLFYEQWASLRSFAAERGVSFLGDVPIFVAHDSADVWAHPELFRLSADGTPSVVAGVPPDYFSATGQLWGNPVYRWDAAERTGFSWWIDRFRSALLLADRVRLDHFRGFEAHWEVPSGQTTAIDGRWVKGPGAGLLEAVFSRLGSLPIVAENLGVITDEVEDLRERFALPGMAVLQFAFGGGPDSPFAPHNYERRLVAYTGTHDNDTTVGWWRSAGEDDSTRSREDVERERETCRAYLGTEGDEIHWDFIRSVLSSVADTAIVPAQDLLGLGSEARMNFPGREHGNWRWRLRRGALDDRVRLRFLEMARLFGRSPREPERGGEQD